MSRCPERMSHERRHVQSERAAFTVTQQQSNKSAFALRNVNPRSAILRSRQRLENSNAENGKLRGFFCFFLLAGREGRGESSFFLQFFEKSSCKSENVQPVRGGGAPVQSEVRQQPQEVSGPRTARTARLPVSSAPPPPFPSLLLPHPASLQRSSPSNSITA